MVLPNLCSNKIKMPQETEPVLFKAVYRNYNKSVDNNARIFHWKYFNAWVAQYKEWGCEPVCVFKIYPKKEVLELVNNNEYLFKLPWPPL